MDIISSVVFASATLWATFFVRIQGEDVLEEAITFTTYHLNRFRSEIDSNLLIREKVSRALHQSIHREVPIIGARYYIPIYEKEESSNELIVRFAKLNFNYLQSLYQKELFDLTRWWRDSNMCSKVPYVRDRIVESYVWGVDMNYEPQYSFARATVAKVIQLTTVLDDTYDTYAPLEDLEIFTQRESKSINDGENVTAVDCYMKQYGVSKEEALNKFAQLAEEMWMSMNKEWVETVFVPRQCLKPFLSYGRLAITCLENGDGFTYPEEVIKSQILALFVDPMI
ncbi:gamma-cadinene synthase-like [Henckelia pumila]|uniref:gamma-cadinene synthase-like n=1 Tax=Henckelia pumila TaxID=405737 RepID=UPI003C6E4645